MLSEAPRLQIHALSMSDVIGETIDLTADDFVLRDAATGRELPAVMGHVAGTRLTILLPFGLREG